MTCPRPDNGGAAGHEISVSIFIISHLLFDRFNSAPIPSAGHRSPWLPAGVWQTACHDRASRQEAISLAPIRRQGNLRRRRRRAVARPSGEVYAVQLDVIGQPGVPGT